MHSPCTVVSGESCSQGLQFSDRLCSHTFLRSQFTCLRSEAALLGDLGRNLSFSGISAENSCLGDGRNTLKTFFLHSDPVFSTFVFLALPSLICSALFPISTPRSIKLQQLFVWDSGREMIPHIWAGVPDPDPELTHGGNGTVRRRFLLFDLLSIPLQ